MNRVCRFVGNLSIDSHRLSTNSVRVEAWRRSGGHSTLMGSCLADEQGRFDFNVSAMLGGDDVVFFRVVVEGVIVSSSEGVIELHEADPDRDITLIVPPDMTGIGSPPGGPSVSGVVLQAAGGPMAGVTVRAFDEMLRHEVQLGQATTDAQGNYLILYAVSQLAHKGGRPADLLVRAYDAQMKVVGQSPILFRAPEEAQINVVVGGTTFLGFSEFEQVQQALTPELDGASAAALSADDITFLTSDTALDPERVQDYADASRLAPALGVAVASVYGLLREGLPADATAIQTASPQQLRDALADAVASNIVPASLAATIDAVISALTASAVTAALAPPPAGQINVGTIVSASGASSTVQQAVLKAFSDPDAPPAATWAALRTQVGTANAAAVDRTQLAIQLAVFTHNHPPLIAHLLGLVLNGKPVASLQDLAGLSRVDWFNMLALTQGGQVIGTPPDVPGATTAERDWSYATTLARAVEEAFPSQVLGARLKAAPASAVNNDVVRFLAQSPTFHLVNTSVDTFVSQNPASLTGVTSTAADDLRAEELPAPGPRDAADRRDPGPVRCRSDVGAGDRPRGPLELRRDVRVAAGRGAREHHLRQRQPGRRHRAGALRPIQSRVQFSRPPLDGMARVRRSGDDVRGTGERGDGPHRRGLLAAHGRSRPGAADVHAALRIAG